MDADLRERFREYAETREQTLRSDLVERHLGLAKHLARRFTHRGEALDDLFQVASMALVKAVDRFDPEVGVAFATYATRTILGELKRHFRDRAWSVRAPRRIQERYLALSETTEALSQRLGHSPTIRELAEETGASEEEILEAMEAGNAYKASSLESRVTSDGGTLEERLASEPGDFEHAEWSIMLPEILATLPERDRLVIRLRFDEELTQSEIAERVGVSQMQVSRVLAKSLQSLRETCNVTG